jgi:hypothetical protein
VIRAAEDRLEREVLALAHGLPPERFGLIGGIEIAAGRHHRAGQPLGDFVRVQE